MNYIRFKNSGTAILMLVLLSLFVLCSPWFT